MKTLPQLLIILAVLVAACSDDDQKANVDTSLLQQYDWVLVKQAPSDGRVVAVIGMPFPYLNQVPPVLTFTGAKSGVYTQMGTGSFIQGSWKIEGDHLIMSGKSMKLKKLTEQELVYITPDKFNISWRGSLK